MLNFKGIKALGGLYLDGNPVNKAGYPWSSYVTLNGNQGDIPNFQTAPTMERWKLGNTPTENVQQLNWVHFEENGKQLLVCDRNVLSGVSWDTLNASGFVEGRIIEIDGNSYLCRLLSGGVTYRDSDKDGGVPYYNEWDRLVLNEESIQGLPTLSTHDEDEDAVYEDQQTTAHNTLWNWVGMFSWCKDTYTEVSSYRVIRGYFSARTWRYSTSSLVLPSNGWRPVLESL